MDIDRLADRATMTPAERAVMVEQAETAKVALDVLIQKCKDDTPGNVIRSLVPVMRATEYMSNVVSQRIGAVIQEDERGDGCG